MKFSSGLLALFTQEEVEVLVSDATCQHKEEFIDVIVLNLDGLKIVEIYSDLPGSIEKAIIQDLSDEESGRIISKEELSDLVRKHPVKSSRERYVYE